MFRNASIFLPYVLTVLQPALQIPSPDQEAQYVSVRLPDDVASESVQISYFLRGSFGGYGSYTRQKAGRHSYQIPSSMDGKAATEMRLIVYAPGCAIQTFIIDLGERTKPSLEFECHRMPTVKLSGAIVPEGLTRDGNAELIVTYFAYWSHSFFGIGDGLVVQIQVGKGPVRADGQFSIDIPDFTSADALPRYRENGSFGLALRDAKTWNPISSGLEVEPADLLGKGQELRILSFYPALTVHVSQGPVSSRLLSKSSQLPAGAR